MKSTLTALALAAAALFFTVDTAEAKLPFSHGYQTRHANKGRGYGHQNNYVKHRVYKVSTCEIDRDRQCRTGYDHCGKPYTYHVTVVTYRDHYSDGSYRTYTKVYS